MRSHRPLLLGPGLSLCLALLLGLSACSDDADEASGSATASSSDATSPAADPTTEPSTSAGGTGPSDEQFVRQLETLFGLDSDDAQCFVDTYADAGLSMADVTAIGLGNAPDDVDPEAFSRASAEAANCLDPEERDAFLAKGVELAPPSSIRNGFIASFIASAPPGVTEKQAGCVYDTMIDDGLDIADLATAPDSPEVTSAIKRAVKECGIN